MKKFYSVIAGLLLSINIWAQAPQKMSYQAVIRNASNALIVNQSVGMRISILQGSVSGTSVYTETHNTTTNANGLVSVEIGGGTVISGIFSNINWTNGPYFVKTETDPNGGTNYTIVGISQLLSVPYALFSEVSSKCSDPNLWSTSGNSILNNQSFIGTTDTFPLKLKVNRVNSGLIDFKNSITSIGYNTINDANSGGYWNVAFGTNTLTENSSGYGNISIGVQNLFKNKTGFSNVSIGCNSQQNSEEAVYNITLGHGTLSNNKKGNSNIAIGNNALSNFDFPVNIAAYNTAVGEGSMGKATIGYRNNGFGCYSLHNLTSGQQNTAIGIDAGRSLQTGNSNIFIGNNTDVTDSSISNSVVIGNNAIAKNSHTIILGDETDGLLNIGIGTSNPERKLHIKSVMRLEPLNQAPSSPSRGDIYYDGLINKLRVYDGTVWQNCW